MSLNGNSVRVERTGPVAEVVLNRPEARNAVNLELCHAIAAAFDGFLGDSETRAVVLRAEGPVFCAGADLRERQGRDEPWVLARRQAAFKAYAAIEACPVPVVCAVHGAVVGSGGEIAMACDFVIASEAASFIFPEPQWGTVGATQRLQRVVGLGCAKELLFTGRKMSAQEAHQRGLVARLVAPAELTSIVAEVAQKIAGAPSLAMRLTKQCMDQGSRTDLASGIDIEFAAIRQLLGGGEWRSGIARFAADVGKES